MTSMRAIGALLLALLITPALADVAAAPLGTWAVGDCVVFREGGVGRVLKTPTYWFSGRIAAITREKMLAGVCPEIGKPASAFTPADWARLAEALPCVERAEDVREVVVERLSVAVDEWETPWSNLHATAGWLFRGEFLGQKLVQGGLVSLDARWIARCAP